MQDVLRLTLLILALGVSSQAAESADSKASLMEADRQFDRDTAALGLDGWMKHYAEDAQMNHPSGIIRGKPAMREQYSKMFSLPGFSLRWAPEFAEASKDGTLGYTFGTGELRYRDQSGNEVTHKARYLTVWRRQPDGSWKVAIDHGS